MAGTQDANVAAREAGEPRDVMLGLHLLANTCSGGSKQTRRFGHLGYPQPPRRRLEHPREGTEGGEVPWGDSGSAGKPEGRDRRAPGETWSQLS